MIIANRGGHTKNSTGANGFINELIEDRKVIKRINELLSQFNTIVDCTPSENSGNGEWNIGVNTCNNSNAEIFFSIHFNAGGGTGCECIKHSTDNKIVSYANSVLNNLDNLGFVNRGIKNNDELAETSNIKCPSMIIEVCFVDTRTDTNLYNNLGVEKVARAIANGIDKRVSLNEIVENSNQLKYQGHIQNIGWQEVKSNDEICGTTGQSLRLEALMVTYPGVMFRAHIENLGWTNYRSSGEMIGTMGSSLRIEAIEILSSDLAFSVHIEGTGWTGYATNSVLGTTGQAKRIEAIRIKQL